MILMSIKQNVKMSIQNINDRRIVKAKRNNELKKFELLERKNIYENINLSLAQKQNIDELYIKYYGERIPYIWHRYPCSDCRCSRIPAWHMSTQSWYC